MSNDIDTDLDDSVIDPNLQSQCYSSTINKARIRENTDSYDNSEIAYSRKLRIDLRIQKSIQNKLLFNGDFFRVKEQVNKTIFEKNMSGLIAICQICKLQIKGTVTVTSNFVKHLRTVHPTSYDEYIKKQANKQLNEKCIKTNQDDFDARLIFFIVDTVSPISIVEKKSFVDLFKETELQVRSRPKVVQLIDSEFDRLVGLIKAQIAENKYFCTTADIWSGKKRSFFGYTCHWLDDEFTRKSVALACKRFSGSHTYDRIADFLYEINGKFGLSPVNIVATITDNGSNFVKAFKEFGLKPEDHTLENSVEPNTDEHLYDSVNNEYELPEFFDEYHGAYNALPKHIRCASHTLNLLATSDFLKLLKENTDIYCRHQQAINKCTNLWNKSNRPKTAEIIVGILDASLITPTVTRWNSLYNSISRILLHKQKLDDLCNALQVPKFSQNDLEYLEEYRAIMEPIADTLDFLQRENNLYFGYLIPSLVTLKTKLRKLALSNTLKLLAKEVSTLEENLVKRFKPFFFLEPEADDAIVGATLCPTVKIKWFASISKIGSSRSLEDIKSTVMRYASAAITDSGCEVLEEINDESNNEADIFFDYADYDTTSAHASSSCIETTPSYSTRTVENEFSMYMTDSCKTWNMLNKYPLLKNAFLKCNSILTSSAPVERLFSFAELVNAPRRHSLSDEMFEKLVVMKANWHMLQ